MLIQKFNLYNAEWLDVVFAKRNKDYGAYYLRQHYADNLVKAMLISIFSITGIALVVGVAIKVKPSEVLTTTVVDLTPYKPPLPPKEEIKKPEPVEAKKSPPQNTKKFVEMVVTSEPVIEEPATIKELEKVAVASVTTTVPGGGESANVDPNAGKGGGGTSTVGEDVSVHDFKGLEVMPEPLGGAGAWAKFLQKNLRYPGQAADQGVGGKVWVSFIVEKDGRLSSFTLLKGAGYGMDDEAMRVLKLAPAWRPGVQNGQAVRVKYTIPINFAMEL